jgi:hypothetical protein
MTLSLKFLHTQNGMTREQFATDSAPASNHLSKLERGLSSPSIGPALKNSLLSERRYGIS